MPSTDDHARAEGRRAISNAIVAMARAAGVPLPVRRPSYAERPAPADGIRFAVMLRDSAAHAIREHIKEARADGMTWQQIGEALNLAPAAEEHGASVADLAFDYATGPADSHWNRTYGPSVTWCCPACGEMVSDRGPVSGPHDNERGHKEDCARLAAAVAEYEAMWEDE